MSSEVLGCTLRPGRGPAGDRLTLHGQEVNVAVCGLKSHRDFEK